MVAAGRAMTTASGARGDRAEGAQTQLPTACREMASGMMARTRSPPSRTGTSWGAEGEEAEGGCHC